MATDPEIKSELQRRYPDTYELIHEEQAELSQKYSQERIEELLIKYSDQVEQLSIKFADGLKDGLLYRYLEKHGFTHALETEITFGFFDFTEAYTVILFDMIMNEDIRL